MAGATQFASEEDVDCPQVDDRRMLDKQCLQRLCAEEVESEAMFGAILEHDCEFRAIAVLMIFAHLLRADDATSRSARQRSHGRDHAMAAHTTQLVDDARKSRLRHVVENDIVTQHNVKMFVVPGPMARDVVLDEGDLPIAACIAGRDTPPRDFELSSGDVEVTASKAKPRARAAACIEHT